MTPEQFSSGKAQNYDVVTMNTKCMGNTFEAKDIQAKLNEKGSEGMVLVHMYQDAQVGGCGNKATLIMIFSY